MFFIPPSYRSVCKNVAVQYSHGSPGERTEPLNRLLTRKRRDSTVNIKLVFLAQPEGMATARLPTLTKGAIWLALRLLGLHGVKSIIVCLPAIAGLVLCGLVYQSHLLLLGLFKVGIPAFVARQIESFLLLGLIGGLLVLIAVLAQRGIIISAAGDNPTVDVETSSFAHPTIFFALRRGWLVLVIVASVYLAIHMIGGNVAHNGPKALIFIGAAIAFTLMSVLSQPLGLVLLALLLGMIYLLGRIALRLFNDTLIHFGAAGASGIDVFSVAKAKWGQFTRLVINLLLLLGIPFILAQSWLPKQYTAPQAMPSFSQVETAPSSGLPSAAGDNLFFAIADLPALFGAAYIMLMVGLGMILIAYAAAVIWIKSAEVAQSWSLEKDDGSTVTRAPREGDPTNVLEAILRRPDQAGFPAQPVFGASQPAQFGQRRTSA